MKLHNAFAKTISENLTRYSEFSLLSIKKDEFEESLVSKILHTVQGSDFISITYGEFFHTASLISKLLPEADYLININLKNRADFFLCAAAVFLSGKGAVLIPPDSNDLSAYKLEKSGFTISRTALDSIISIFQEKQAQTEIRADLSEIQNMILQRDDAAAAAVIFTSGSTSGPKAVPVSGYNFYSSFSNTRSLFPYNAEDKWYLSLPPYHIGGFSVFIRALLSGMEVIAGKTNPEEKAFYQEIKSTGSNYVSLVPTQIQRICRNNIKSPESIRYVLIGGAPAEPGLIRKAVELGWPLHVVYGMTETTAFFAGGKVTGKEKQGFTGKPLGDCTVRFTDQSGEESDRGVIRVSSGAVTAGYVNDDQSLTDRFFNGSFLTSDSGFCDAQGNLYITGRTDNIIITGGRKVDPAEIEEVLRRILPGVQSVVVGIKDKEWGEKVTAFIESEKIPQDLSTRLKNLLEGYKVPKEILCLKDFPLTGPGKIDRQALKRDYQKYTDSV